MTTAGVITLWRPTGEKELALVREAGWRRWPPRLPEQPIFYPVLNEEYATQIAREWNTKEGGTGCVTRFEVDAAFASRYERQVVGGQRHEEFWVPADELDELNTHIAGAIEVVSAWTGEPPMRLYEIDGSRFATLEGFFADVSTRVIPGTEWGRNLAAFNDILRGGFGTPEDGFVLRWRDSERSRSALGWPETVAFLERKLTTCHPSNVDHVRADLEAAHRGDGQTLFDILIDIISEHGDSGREAEDHVVLELQ